MSYAVHIDRFSAGLDDLTRKQQADHIAVLRVLARTKRFSCFEASENQVIAKTMDRLLWKECTTVNGVEKIKHGVLLKRTGGEYPWTTVELTDAGKRLISEAA
jgi:hypothetical protein